MHIRRVVIALIIGLVVTIAVSWLAMFLPRGNAWYGPLATTDIGLWREPDDHKTWQMSRGDNAWHSVVTYWHMQISGMSLMMHVDDYEARKYDYHDLPSHFRPDTLHDLNMTAWFHETGWPFGAMSVWVQWNKQVRNSDIIYDVFGGYQLPRDVDFNPRALPLTPIWPGFVLNVVFYAAIWLALKWSVRTARTLLRTRENCCPHCGYSRTGLAEDALCPECGKH